MPLEDGETRPDYPRPPCAPSFIKSGLIPILNQYFTHSLYAYAGETIMPPRVLASGPKPCGGNHFPSKIVLVSVLKYHLHALHSCYRYLSQCSAKLQLGYDLKRMTAL